MSDLDERTTAHEKSPPLRMTAKQRQILVLLLGAQFMLAADFTILTVALPEIGTALGFSLDNLQWITTGFALPAAGFTLLFGRAADLYGRRRLFLAGLSLLAIASLVGGLATTPEVLIAARVAQGVATAISIPSGLSLLTTSFPEGPLRQRALGLNGSLLGGGFTAGALLGGLLTDLLSWRWSFLINLPLAVLIIIGTLMIIRDSRSEQRTRLDVPGAVVVTAGLLALVYGITRAGHSGWGDPLALASFAAAIALLVGFWFIELRSPNPLAPVRVLRAKTVVWGNIGGLVNVAMGTGISFVMTLYMQKVLDYSALAAGIALGGPGLFVIVGGTVAPKVIAKLGAPRTLAVSLFMQAVAYAVLLFTGEDRASFTLVLVTLAVGFFAHAFGLVAYMVTATSGLPNEEQGLATGLTTMSMQIGITVGIPILSAIAAAQTAALASGDPDRTAILGGLHTATLSCAVFLLVGGLLVAVMLRKGRTTTPVG